MPSPRPLLSHYLLRGMAANDPATIRTNGTLKKIGVPNVRECLGHYHLEVAVGNLQSYECGPEPHPTLPLRVPAVTTEQQTVVTGVILKRRSAALKSGKRLI